MNISVCLWLILSIAGLIHSGLSDQSANLLNPEAGNLPELSPNRKTVPYRELTIFRPYSKQKSRYCSRKCEEKRGDCFYVRTIVYLTLCTENFSGSITQPLLSVLCWHLCALWSILLHPRPGWVSCMQPDYCAKGGGLFPEFIPQLLPRRLWTGRASSQISMEANI